MTRTTSATPQQGQQRGSVLEVLTALLREQRNHEVIALVEQLVARNRELERRLAGMLWPRSAREGVSTAQLRLLLEELASQPCDDVAANHEHDDATEGDAAEGDAAKGDARQGADELLRAAADIDAAKDAASQPSEPSEPSEPSQRPPKQPPLRRPIPAALRRVDNPLPVPAKERPCPSCGVERTCIGHDVTEVIELVPAEVIVRRDMREKLACTSCEGNLARGPVGDKIVAGGRLGPLLVAGMMVDKYDDGVPLHRQKQRLERLGLSLPVSTMADQIKWCTELLEPVARACLDAVLSATVMHIDATGLPVLARDHAQGKKLGALWGVVGDNQTAAYVYNATGKKRGYRHGELGPEELLARRSGFTVADASTMFDASFARPDLIECGCNMHARRYFVKALERGDKRAALPLAAFKKLYEIEREHAGSDALARLAARRARSKPVYDELVAWCEVHQPYEPPRSPMGAAIRYLLNHRVALIRFLDDGRIPPDNGAVERLHVRAALTRKNYLFAGSDAGGDRAAIAYTILGSCRLAGVNPSAYLADVLPNLARGIRLRDVAELIPARWTAARAASSPDAAM